jgi:hypothetical protein
MLREIAPRIKHVAIIYDPEAPLTSAPFAAAALAAGSQFSRKVTQIRIYRLDELESAISGFASEPDGALVFPPDILPPTIEM